MERVDSYCTGCESRTEWLRIGEMEGFNEGTRYHMYNCGECETTKCLQTLLKENSVTTR